MDVGIHEDVSWEDYLRLPYMNPSTLKSGQRSMRRLKRAIDGEIYPPAKTVAVGQVTHCILAGEDKERIAVLPEYELDADNMTAGKEKKPPAKMYTTKGDLSAAGKKWEELCVEHGVDPGKVDSIFVDRVQTDSKATAYYKASVASFNALNEDKDVVTSFDYRKAQGIVERLQGHRHCAELVDKSRQEMTIIGTIEGMKVKTRIDGLWNDGPEWGAWDLKTTSDIAPDAFYRICRKFGYLFQFAFHVLALQSCGIQLQSYDIIAAEIQDDFDVGVIGVPFNVLDDWGDIVCDVMKAFKLALASDRWPGLYDDTGAQGLLEIPNWDMGNVMEEFSG
jgi:hypothetical protein